MGLLLKQMGQLEEARPLYEEALQACEPGMARGGITWGQMLM